MCEQDEMMRLISNLSKQHDKLYNHSVCVSMFSCLLGKKLGWITNKTISFLSTGGFYHDIGKKMLPQELIDKKKEEEGSS